MPSSQPLPKNPSNRYVRTPPRALRPRKRDAEAMWGTVENLAPTSRDLAAGRCINILSGEVCPGEVFIIFGGPQGHADRLATCGRLAIGLPLPAETSPHRRLSFAACRYVGGRRAVARRVSQLIRKIQPAARIRRSAAPAVGQRRLLTRSKCSTMPIPCKRRVGYNPHDTEDYREAP